MPVWRIFAHPSIFTHDQKRSFAEDVTAMYVSRGLPKFYVNVLFIPLEEDELWIGGEPRNDFVRIIIEQIARQLVNKDEDVEGLRKKFMERVNSVSWMDIMGFGKFAGQAKRLFWWCRGT